MKRARKHGIHNGDTTHSQDKESTPAILRIVKISVCIKINAMIVLSLIFIF